jgi:hypothetical protein
VSTYNAAYYRTHTASRNAYNRAYYATHPEKCAYRAARANGYRRDVPWMLTFDSWWFIVAPYWHLRGTGADQYCMARHGDVGPYALGNVSMITNADNRRERVVA